MRIAFTGTQGTGKTSLVEALGKEEIFKDYILLTGITRKAMEKGFAINKQGDDSTQLEIARMHLENIQSYTDFLADRCILDCLAYTEYLYEHGKVKQDTSLRVRRIAQDTLSKYDFIFYVEPEFDIEETDIRSSDKNYQTEVLNIFRKNIELLSIPVIRLRGSLENRVRQVLKEINNVN